MITFSCKPSAIPWEPTWLPGPNGRRLKRVIKRIEVRSNGGYLNYIEPGFLSDQTSWPSWFMMISWIPPIKRWLRDRHGKYSLAALLHDDLLKTRLDMPKWRIDDAYHDALRSLSTSALESFIFWMAVRTRTPGKKKA